MTGILICVSLHNYRKKEKKKWKINEGDNVFVRRRPTCV